jgi:hypothetical protein
MQAVVLGLLLLLERVARERVFWGLDPFGAHAPQIHARITVDE